MLSLPNSLSSHTSNSHPQAQPGAADINICQGTVPKNPKIIPPPQPDTPSPDIQHPPPKTLCKMPASSPTYHWSLCSIPWPMTQLLHAPGHKNWLTTVQQVTTPTQPENDPTPQTTITQNFQPPPNPSNKWWGGIPYLDPLSHIIHVLSCNVDTLSIANDFIAWRATTQGLADYCVDVACIQETNPQ